MSGFSARGEEGFSPFGRRRRESAREAGRVI